MLFHHSVLFLFPHFICGMLTTLFSNWKMRMFKLSSNSQFDLMELFNTLTNFILFNMLWLLGSLFIITIPAATAALFASVAPWGRGQAPDTPLLSFWTAVRHYWLKATIIGLIDLVVGGLVALNLFVIQQMGFEQFFTLPAFILTILLGVFLVLANVYLWPLLVTVDQPWRSLLKNSLRLTVAHPFWALLVAVVAALPVVMGILLPRFILLTLSFAGAALVTYWGSWRRIKPYLDEDDLSALGIEESD
jgi:uncharacterized membrane protein YesL